MLKVLYLSAARKAIIKRKYQKNRNVDKSRLEGQMIWSNLLLGAGPWPQLCLKYFQPRGFLHFSRQVIACSCFHIKDCFPYIQKHLPFFLLPLILSPCTLMKTASLLSVITQYYWKTLSRHSPPAQAFSPLGCTNPASQAVNVLQPSRHSPDYIQFFSPYPYWGDQNCTQYLMCVLTSAAQNNPTP